MSIERAIVYIDGFNLYHGLMQARLGSSRWLDLSAMSRLLQGENRQLELVRYFTARVRDRPRDAERQSVYIDALRSRGGVEIDFGFFLRKNDIECSRCQNSWPDYEEKKTDVNIAVRLLNDALDDRFDVALIVSGDSDLVPAVESVRTRYPDKRLIVAFPPKRRSVDLEIAAHASFGILNSQIRASRLPNPVVTPEGIALRAPTGWTPRPTSL